MTDREALEEGMLAAFLAATKGRCEDARKGIAAALDLVLAVGRTFPPVSEQMVRDALNQLDRNGEWAVKLRIHGPDGTTQDHTIDAGNRLKVTVPFSGLNDNLSLNIGGWVNIIIEPIA